MSYNSLKSAKNKYFDFSLTHKNNIQSLKFYCTRRHPMPAFLSHKIINVQNAPQKI